MDREKRPKVGVALLLLQEQHILLGKRKNIRGDGYYAFPGGHVEYRETTLNAGKRELEEETGLIASTLRILDWVENPALAGQDHYITFCYLVEAVKGHLENKEPEKCHGWEWHPINALPEPLFVTIPLLLDKHPLEMLARETAYTSSGNVPLS